MSKHMDMLTGYNIKNECKVCKEKFVGYAELRDHVQTHGENFREPYGHPEAYRYGIKYVCMNCRHTRSMFYKGQCGFFIPIALKKPSNFDFSWSLSGP